MTKSEKLSLGRHVGHNVVVTDYRPGEPESDFDGGRYCIECLTCGGAIILGDRVLVGQCEALSVT